MYEYGAIIKRVIDGDTVVVDLDYGLYHWQHDMRIRLARINAAELYERNHDGTYVKGLDGKRVADPEGFAALDYLALTLMPGARVVLKTVKNDKYGGRFDAEIFVGDVNVNDLMIRAGHAAPYV